MNWRLLAASCIQEEDIVGRSHGENMGPIREQWLLKRSSKTITLAGIAYLIIKSDVYGFIG